jgi:predicted homoserine dehydrogenase-like protein
VHLVGIADLSPDGARATSPASAGATPRPAPSASTPRSGRGTTHIGDDWQALVSHPAIDVVVECTGHPIAAVEHCLRAYANGKHVVNVTVEADAFCGRCWRRRRPTPASSIRSPSATSRR